MDKKLSLAVSELLGWREGNLTAHMNEGWDTTWNTGAFLLIAPKPYSQNSISGGKFRFLALGEREDRYTGKTFYTVYSVPVAIDGSQNGHCSYCQDIQPDPDLEGSVAHWSWVKGKFQEIHEYFAQRHEEINKCC